VSDICRRSLIAQCWRHNSPFCRNGSHRPACSTLAELQHSSLEDRCDEYVMATFSVTSNGLSANLPWCYYYATLLVARSLLKKHRPHPSARSPSPSRVHKRGRIRGKYHTAQYYAMLRRSAVRNAYVETTYSYTVQDNHLM
jgi:hypothetical protein